MRPVMLLVLLVISSCATVREVSLEEQHKAQVLVDQGTAFLRRGDLHRAQASFEVSRDLGGGAAALDGLGAVAFRKGEYDEAEKYFMAAIQSDREYSMALGNLALLYELTGREEEARTVYQYALQVSPDDVRARNNYAARLYDDQKRPQAFIELMRAEAVARHPIVEDNLRKAEKVQE